MSYRFSNTIFAERRRVQATMADMQAAAAAAAAAVAAARCVNQKIFTPTCPNKPGNERN